MPSVRKTVVNFVIKNNSSTEAYKSIKEISLSAVEFIQSQGEHSSEKLEQLVVIVSQELERSAIFLNKKDVVATIISAINS